MWIFLHQLFYFSYVIFRHTVYVWKVLVLMNDLWYYVQHLKNYPLFLLQREDLKWNFKFWLLHSIKNFKCFEYMCFTTDTSDCFVDGWFGSMIYIRMTFVLERLGEFLMRWETSCGSCIVYKWVWTICEMHMWDRRMMWPWYFPICLIIVINILISYAIYVNDVLIFYACYRVLSWTLYVKDFVML